MEDSKSAGRPSLNPYARAAALVMDRLKWDLSPESWRSRRLLNAARGQYLGQRAVILCNGPSLNRVDFSLLKDCFCFGLNKINLLFDRTDFRPSAIVSVNPLVIEQNAEFFNSTKIPLYLSSVGRRHIRRRPNITFTHSSPVIKFARDSSVSIYEGATVTVVALQLAFHLGFREVALVGADHYFSTTGPAGKAVVSGDKDDNHFDPRYFSAGMKWQLPDLFTSEIGYTLAKQAFELVGGRVVNATDGGQLEVFERMALQSFLGIGSIANTNAHGC